MQTLSRAETVVATRAALLRFLDHHGVDPGKYNEQVTVYWLDTVAQKLDEIGADVSVVEKCKQVIAAFSSPARIPATRVGVEV